MKRTFIHQLSSQAVMLHDSVIKWKLFRVTGPLCEEFTGHWRIPLTKADDAELWFFLWSALEQMLSKPSRRRWFESHRTYHGVTVMWVEFHGGARKVVSHDMPISSVILVSVVLISYSGHYCKFTTIVEIKYEVVVCSRKWYITNVYFVAMLGAIFADRTADAGWKWFSPSINPLFHAFKTYLFVHFHFSGCGSGTHLFMGFPEYTCTYIKSYNSIHQLLTSEPNSSLKARSHVGQQNALARISKHLNINSRRVVYNSFIMSNINHCKSIIKGLNRSKKGGS